jgi:phosphonate transport system substrate-binding protein
VFRLSKALIPILTGLFLLPIGWDAAFAQTAVSSDASRALVIGRITGKPSSQYDKLAAFNQFIIEELGDKNITQSKVLMASNPQEMAEYLKSGKVDYLSETLFTALFLEYYGLADIALHEWKGGVSSYHALIIVRNDSPVQKLEDLAGGKILFEDRGSTTGFMLPFVHLRDSGLKFAPPSGNQQNAAQDLTYDFAGDETTIVGRVLRGQADAGVLSNEEWENTKKTPAPFKSHLRVIGQTPDAVRSLILTRRGLDPDLKQRLMDVLTSLHKSERGREALKSYFHVTKFDRFTEKSFKQVEQIRNTCEAYHHDLLSFLKEAE